jgi:hypothetical protein
MPLVTDSTTTVTLFCRDWWLIHSFIHSIDWLIHSIDFMIHSFPFIYSDEEQQINSHYHYNNKFCLVHAHYYSLLLCSSQIIFRAKGGGVEEPNTVERFGVSGELYCREYPVIGWWLALHKNLDFIYVV